MRKRGRPSHPGVLTPREWEVLALLRDGLTNEQIAQRLDVSVATARYHVSEILSKLGVTSREEAAAWQPEPARQPPWAGVAGGLRPLTLAKAAAATAALVALAGLGVLVWGVLRTSEEGDAGADAQATGNPSATLVPTIASGEQLSYVGAEGAIYTVDHLGSPTSLGNPGACSGATLFSWSPAGDEALCYDGMVRTIIGGRGQVLSLSTSVYDLFDFAWSPTGSAFAYGVQDKLIVSDPAGAEIADLGPTELGPALAAAVAAPGRLWSPDGNAVAYWAADNRELRVFSFDSGDRAVGGDLRPLAWMSDGQRILVAKNYMPPDERGFFSYHVAIFSLTDGSVSLVPELEATPNGPVRANLQLWLSPDTSKAVVLTTRADGFPGLGVFDMTSRALTVIPDSIITFGSDHIPMGNVQWSPDGAEIYWVDMQSGMTVYTARANGTGLRRLVDLPGGRLAFSPDFRSMAYSIYDNGGNSTLYVSDIDGHGAIAIGRQPAVRGIGAGFAFAWRPMPSAGGRAW